MDWILLVFIAIQAGIDVSRDLDWSRMSHVTRIHPTKSKNLFLLVFSIFLVVVGKLHFMLSGTATLGIIGLYLLMIAYFLQIYPYIICTPTTLYLCVHALSPKISVEKEDIVSATKENSTFSVIFQHEQEPLQRIQIDGRVFTNTEKLEDWLGHLLHPETATKKAA